MNEHVKRFQTREKSQDLAGQGKLWYWLQKLWGQLVPVLQMQLLCSPHFLNPIMLTDVKFIIQKSKCISQYYPLFLCCVVELCSTTLCWFYTVDEIVYTLCILLLWRFMILFVLKDKLHTYFMIFQLCCLSCEFTLAICW